MFFRNLCQPTPEQKDEAAADAAAKEKIILSIKTDVLRDLNPHLLLNELPENMECNVAYLEVGRFSWPSVQFCTKPCESDAQSIGRVGNLVIDTKTPEAAALAQLLKDRIAHYMKRRLLGAALVINGVAGLIFTCINGSDDDFGRLSKAEKLWGVFSTVSLLVPCEDKFFDAYRACSKSATKLLTNITHQELTTFLNRVAEGKFQRLKRQSTELHDYLDSATPPENMPAGEFKRRIYKILGVTSPTEQLGSGMRTGLLNP